MFNGCIFYPLFFSFYLAPSAAFCCGLILGFSLHSKRSAEKAPCSDSSAHAEVITHEGDFYVDLFHKKYGSRVR